MTRKSQTPITDLIRTQFHLEMNVHALVNRIMAQRPNASRSLVYILAHDEEDRRNANGIGFNVPCV